MVIRYHLFICLQLLFCWCFAFKLTRVLRQRSSKLFATTSSPKLRQRDGSLKSSLGANAARYTRVPIVYCQVKVLSLRKIDELNSVYDIDFQLNLDWDDPLLNADNGDDGFMLPDYFDHTQYFDPCIIIENSISTDVEPIGGKPANSLAYTLDGAGNIISTHVHRSERYRTSLIAPPNLLLFPFDDNVLPIKLKSLPVPPFGSRAVPLRVILDDGYNGGSPKRSWKHEVSQDADGLSEWVVGDLVIPSRDRLETLMAQRYGFGGNLGGGTSSALVAQRYDEDDDYTATYQLGIQIVRECWSGFWSLIFPLLTTSSLGFTMYASEPSDVNSRLCNTITCCLTVVLFKYIVEERLPQVPFLTVLDKYLVGTTLILFYQGFGHAVAGFVSISSIFNAYFGFEPDSSWGHYIDLWFWSSSVVQYLGLQWWMTDKLTRASKIKNEYDRLNGKEGEFGFYDGFLDQPIIPRKSSA